MDTQFDAPRAGTVPPAALEQGAAPLEWFRPGPPDVRVERILRIQGYSDLGRVRPAIRRAAELAAQWATELSAPVVCSRRVPVAGLAGERLELAGGVVLRCAAFGKFLTGCTEVVPFALTIGPAVDARVVELTAGGEGLLEALLLETAGWLAIEDATRQFRAAARERLAREGARITSRLGPGYSYPLDGGECEWALTDQHALFELLADAELPVQVLPSCAMQPKISRSGLFGVAPTGGR